LRAHATKLTDLDDSQRSGLAALVVVDSCLHSMSETITAGLVMLADKVVAKRDGRAKFSVRPDKLIASLVAQKNATARKEARARRRGQADMSALYSAEKKRITHEIQSRVARGRRENRIKLREKLERGTGFLNTLIERVEK
jgi:biopolymer transport protein ExbB/TolQ